MRQCGEFNPSASPAHEICTLKPKKRALKTQFSRDSSNSPLLTGSAKSQHTEFSKTTEFILSFQGGRAAGFSWVYQAPRKSIPRQIQGVKESCLTMQEAVRRSISSLLSTASAFPVLDQEISCLERGRDSEHLCQLTKQLCYV